MYGLGADATNGRAVAAIFEAKGRPQFNPLIVHVPNLAAAERIAIFTPVARRLAEAFWPGPLTIVLQRRADAGISDLVTAGLESIAVRVPAQPVAQALLAAAERPLAAPSANRSGRVSPTTARHVAEDLGDKVTMVLDGGPTRHGLESTVVAVETDGAVRLLRPGAVTRGDIAAVLDAPLADGPVGEGAHPISPGQLASHYAPETDGPSFNLSPSGDLAEAAAALFAALRELDRTGAATIAVMPIPEHGLGEAINDRLRRAAAPRL